MQASNQYKQQSNFEREN